MNQKTTFISSKMPTLFFLVLAIALGTSGIWGFFSITRNLFEENETKSQKIEMLEKQLKSCK